MDRRTFIGAAAAAAFASPVTARAFDTDFPGDLAVYACRLDRMEPFVSYRPHEIFSSASVIKLLIAVGAMRRIDGASGLEQRLKIAPDEIVGGSETFGTARPDQPATVRRLLTAMIQQSDNTAANVLLDWLGMPNLNALAAELDLEQTRFERHFMSFRARAAGLDNRTSAADMATLARAIALEPRYRFVYELMLGQEDRETIPAGIARSVPIANKTGDLDGVRNDVAIVGKPPHGYVLVLLSQGWPTRAGAVARLRAIAGQIDALAQ